MQTLDVISVNLWDILISLANLYILFLIVKRLLFVPVQNVLAKRQSELDEKYAKADIAVEQAEGDKAKWRDKLDGADSEAQAIVKKAVDDAERRSEKIISDAKDRSDGLIRAAQNEAELERRKAADGIRREIIEVSEALAEKLLDREINAEDHKAMIESVISELGDDNE